VKKRYRVFVNVFFSVTSLAFVLPFLLIIAISFSHEDDVLRHGYSLIVKHFSTEAYAYIFKNPKPLADSYLITIYYAIGNTILGIIIQALTGYTLARKEFKLKKIVLIPLLITMFFTGGRISAYIINTQVFHLQNNPAMFMLWGVMSGFTVLVFRTFFSQIPVSLIESARLDGAGEYKILWHIIAPLSTPIIASIAFLNILGKWNDFECSLYYMRSPQFFTLQFLLQKILNEIEFIKQSMSNIPGGTGVRMPLETIKFAMCVVAAGPMVALFPFFQKFFSKGIAVGAVKG